MSSYYDEDEDVDIHIRRGRGSPVFHDHRYQQPPPPPMAVARPVYYTHGANYLVAEPSAPVRRSRSTSHRGSPERVAAPVIVNNIYKEYDSEEEEDRRYLQLARPLGRARSRSRSRSYASPRSSRESYELEQTRKELEVFKLQVEREKEEKRIKKEMELKRLRMEREAEEEKERIKKESAAAIEKYKIEEAEKAEKAKKEKEEREKEYQTRIRDDLRKSGMNIQPIPPTTYYS
jgi:hypothetical protein